MELFDQIDLALNAHHLWRERLKAAIRTGECEYTVEVVSDDGCCNFGVWLRHLPLPERETREWRQVSRLHARFHQEAAGVLTHALAGERAKAEAFFGDEGAFTRASEQLTRALREWKPVIGRQVMAHPPPVVGDPGLMRHRD